jgi:hypothetical protein
MSRLELPEVSDDFDRILDHLAQNATEYHMSPVWVEIG